MKKQKTVILNKYTMKYILKIFIIVAFILSNKINAQLDTLNYLKTFEANKVKYIGKPLSFLLNDMTQIQPKTVWTESNFKSKNNILANRFKFSEMNQSFHNVITLLIEWESAIPYSEIKYYQNKNHFYFTDDERNFYNNKIIKNISVYR